MQTQNFRYNFTNFKTVVFSLLIALSTLLIFNLHVSYAQSTSGHHGANGKGHDEINMPGLKGENATVRESNELAIMFRNFKKISRNVTNLPDGIRTITFSSDTEVMSVLASHTIGMINRVNEGRDPKVIIQSKTLDILFKRREKIKTNIETTTKGIIVTQTSLDPEVVIALQTHAAEVTDLANRGMIAAHEKMANSQ